MDLIVTHARVVTLDAAGTVAEAVAIRSHTLSKPSHNALASWSARNSKSGSGRGNVYVFGSVDPTGDDPLDAMFAS